MKITNAIPETEYVVEGQCIECGAAIITGDFEGEKLVETCVGCGQKDALLAGKIDDIIDRVDFKNPDSVARCWECFLVSEIIHYERSGRSGMTKSVVNQIFKAVEPGLTERLIEHFVILGFDAVEINRGADRDERGNELDGEAVRRVLRFEAKLDAKRGRA